MSMVWASRSWLQSSVMLGAVGLGAVGLGAVGLGAVGLGGTAFAQAPPAIPLGLPAEPTGAVVGPNGPMAVADEVPDTATARAILKRVKQAERAGYERHDIKRYLALFDPSATVVIGRLATPESYDRTFDFERWSLLKRLETAEPPHPQDLLFFRSAVLKVEGEKARLEIDMRVDFFGGHRVNRVRYDLALKLSRALPKQMAPGRGAGERPEDWLVTAVRFWPLAEQVGVEPLHFDADYWKAKDELVAKPSEHGDELLAMARYLFAWRFGEAEQALVALVAAQPERADAWLALARVRLETADLEGAKAAFAEALKRDKNLTAPALLSSAFPKAAKP